MRSLGERETAGSRNGTIERESGGGREGGGERGIERGKEPNKTSRGKHRDKT
jgi:hypothetical protein